MAPPKADLIGQRNGKLLVVAFLKPLANGSLWLCKCDCGHSHTVTTSNFLRTSSCGCVHKNLINMRFGRLLVVCLHESRRNGRTWRCLCDCGAECFALSSHLLAGMTRSCGCIKTEIVVKRSYKHGLCVGGVRPVELGIFVGAKQRCENPGHPSYLDYGGRGIQFKFSDLKEFMDELGPRPSLEHSVDRIDNDGNYEPGNIRWATVEEQLANRIRRCTICRSVIDSNLATLAGWGMSA